MRRIAHVLVMVVVAQGLTWSAVHHVIGRVLVINHGVAFGMMSSHPIEATIVDGVALAITVWLVIRGPVNRSAAAMVLAGGLANAWDRLIYGGVIDYWRVSFYPFAFNVADLFIRIGVVWLVVSVIRRSPDRVSQ